LIGTEEGHEWLGSFAPLPANAVLAMCCNHILSRGEVDKTVWDVRSNRTIVPEWTIVIHPSWFSFFVVGSLIAVCAVEVWHQIRPAT